MYLFHFFFLLRGCFSHLRRVGVDTIEMVDTFDEEDYLNVGVLTMQFCSSLLSHGLSRIAATDWMFEVMAG